MLDSLKKANGVRGRRHLIPIHRIGFLRFFVCEKEIARFLYIHKHTCQQEPRGREIKVSQKEVLKYISDVTQE
jgi:hypothetical protein